MSVVATLPHLLEQTDCCTLGKYKPAVLEHAAEGFVQCREAIRRLGELLLICSELLIPGRRLVNVRSEDDRLPLDAVRMGMGSAVVASESKHTIRAGYLDRQNGREVERVVQALAQDDAEVVSSISLDSKLGLAMAAFDSEAELLSVARREGLGLPYEMRNLLIREDDAHATPW